MVVQAIQKVLTAEEPIVKNPENRIRKRLPAFQKINIVLEEEQDGNGDLLRVLTLAASSQLSW